MLREIKNEIRDEIREEVRKEFQKDWEKEKKKNPNCDADSWWEERRMGMKVFLGVLMGIGGVGLAFLFGWVVMLLWNWLVPDIFGLAAITYWQAWGLFVLCSILFKGMKFGSDDSGKRSDRRRKKQLRTYMEEEPDLEDDADSPGFGPDPEEPAQPDS